jgi:hypothetical protein
MLRMHESMLSYQLHYGLTPVGDHRRLADQLLGAVTKRCNYCDGDGLFGSSDLATWEICSSCRGYGSLPLPNSPELKAVRAEVAKHYPDAIAPGADDVGPDTLREVLESRAVLVQDLRTGAMLRDFT